MAPNSRSMWTILSTMRAWAALLSCGEGKQFSVRALVRFGSRLSSTVVPAAASSVEYTQSAGQPPVFLRRFADCTHTIPDHPPEEGRHTLLQELGPRLPGGRSDSG